MSLRAFKYNLVKKISYICVCYFTLLCLCIHLLPRPPYLAYTEILYNARVVERTHSAAGSELQGSQEETLAIRQHVCPTMQQACLRYSHGTLGWIRCTVWLWNTFVTARTKNVNDTRS